MKELSYYFRLKEYDRIEAEKKIMIDLKKVIEICLKKSFHFSVNPTCNVINVSTNGFETSFDSYFKGDLIKYSYGNTVTMSELLEKLRKM